MKSYNEYISRRSSSSISVDAGETILEQKLEELDTPLVETPAAKVAETYEPPIPEPTPVQGYKIYRDKAESFVCDMQITGANPNSSKARIIIESKNLTYMFEGAIDAKGKCKIPLRKMNFLDENETGKIKLEVIAEDMVFNPWEDDFVAVSSKKVLVKITESEENNPKIGIKVTNIK